MSAEGSRSADQRKADHMAVIGLTESGLLQFSFPLLNHFIGNLPRPPGP
jgi:hypothetical protein